MTKSTGFIYAATGKSYIEEAALSAGSFKQAMPNTDISIFSDDPNLAQEFACFDQVFEIPNPAFGPSDKFFALQNSPYEKTVFVDTDTWCVDQCLELFRILDRFELGVTHAPVRAMNFVPNGVPRCFPEANTGVIAYRSCNAVIALFEQWRHTYADFNQRKQIQRDQLSFRKALYFSDVALTILPPEYNLRAVFSYFVGGMAPVKIIHARGGDLARALRIIKPKNEQQSIYPYVVTINRS